MHEFGYIKNLRKTDVLDKAADKYGYKNDNKIMFKIEYYLNILLNKPFS